MRTSISFQWNSFLPGRRKGQVNPSKFWESGVLPRTPPDGARSSSSEYKFIFGFTFENCALNFTKTTRAGMSNGLGCTRPHMPEPRCSYSLAFFRQPPPSRWEFEVCISPLSLHHTNFCWDSRLL